MATGSSITCGVPGFQAGKVYTNERPGLGATLEMKLLKPVSEVTQPIRRQIYQRPDGSLTHWLGNNCSRPRMLLEKEIPWTSDVCLCWPRHCA